MKNGNKILIYGIVLAMTVLADAYSVIAVGKIINEKISHELLYFSCLVVIISALSHFLQPLLIFGISIKLREAKFNFIYSLKDKNYFSLERLIQKDEMIFHNLIVSNVQIIIKVVSLLMISLALIISSDLKLLIAISLIPLVVLLYRAIFSKKLKFITTQISESFHAITELRKVGGALSKAAYYNAPRTLIPYINKIYENYYSGLANQNAMSNGYRTSIEVSAYLSIFILASVYQNKELLNSLIVMGYSGLKVLPLVQQLNFYVNVRKNGVEQFEIVINNKLNEKKINEEQLKALYDSRNSVLVIKGISGSGKSTLMDSFADELKAKKIKYSYYVQNQYPLSEILNAKNSGRLNIKNYSLSDILNGKYSIGEIQRIAFLSTIEDDVEYLLLDEPFSSQSTDYMKQMVKMLQEKIARGVKIILISHIDVTSNFQNFSIIECNYDRNNSGTN